MRRMVVRVAAVALFSSALFAAPFCTDVVVTAQDMMNLNGGGCQFGDKILYNFIYDYRNSLSPAVSASNVLVSFYNDGADPLKPNISFTVNPGTGLLGWEALNGDITDIQIIYNLQSSSTSPMIAGRLKTTAMVGDLDPNQFLSSFVSPSETLHLANVGTLITIGQDIIPAPTSPLMLMFTDTGYVSFSAPDTIVSVHKDILIFGGDAPNPGIVTRIEEGLQEGAAVPEPLTSSLLGGGMVAMVLMLRARARSAGRR